MFSFDFYIHDIVIFFSFHPFLYSFLLIFIFTTLSPTTLMKRCGSRPCGHLSRAWCICSLGCGKLDHWHNAVGCPDLLCCQFQWEETSLRHTLEFPAITLFVQIVGFISLTKLHIVGADSVRDEVFLCDGDSALHMWHSISSKKTCNNSPLDFSGLCPTPPI